MLNRREFFKTIFMSACALPFVGKALANSCGEVKDGDKYDYVQEASKAKGNKAFEKHVKNHTVGNVNCAKCKWYKNKDKKATKEAAPCTMLGKKLVCQKGWCNKYKFDKKKA